MKKSKFKSTFLIFSFIICPLLTGCSCTSNATSLVSQKKVGYQLEMPAQDEEIAVITTTFGIIKLRFFPKFAPKAVENFKTHAKNGYYNNVIFHRVINNFMIQTGDPEGTGFGGKSIWDKPFEDEFSDKLLNITGAVSMANCGPNTNGSQFFINQNDKENFSGWENWEKTYDQYKNIKNVSIIDMSKITDDIKKIYNENGGNPYLDGAFNTQHRGHAVFAQVFDGMDVIKKIASVETDFSDKPMKDIKIEKIDIIKNQL